MGGALGEAEMDIYLARMLCLCCLGFEMSIKH